MWFLRENVCRQIKTSGNVRGRFFHPQLWTAADVSKHFRNSLSIVANGSLMVEIQRKLFRVKNLSSFYCEEQLILFSFSDSLNLLFALLWYQLWYFFSLFSTKKIHIICFSTKMFWLTEKTLSGHPLALMLVSWTCFRIIHASSCFPFWRGREKEKNPEDQHQYKRAFLLRIPLENKPFFCGFYCESAVTASCLRAVFAFGPC